MAFSTMSLFASFCPTEALSWAPLPSSLDPIPSFSHLICFLVRSEKFPNNYRDEEGGDFSSLKSNLGGKKLPLSSPTPRSAPKAPPRSYSTLEIPLRAIVLPCGHLFVGLSFLLDSDVLECRRSLVPPQSLTHSRYPVTE